MTTRIAAVLGATGGAGTTRVAVESAALLAATGRDVAVFDAAFQTQGLASYVDEPIETDITAVLTEDAPLDGALYEYPADLSGKLALAPARCPFNRLARAKTAGAAEKFEQHLASAALSHDLVVVDTPPIGGNQGIAAVNEADRIGVVTPDTPRGQDGLALTRERLADIGCSHDVVLANRSTDPVVDADTYIPEMETTPRELSCLPVNDTASPAIAATVEALFDIDITVESPGKGSFSGILGS